MWHQEGRRSSIQVVADMLKLLRLGPASRTEIMHLCNMSYYQMSGYLNNLLRMELLRAAGQDNRAANYQITEKGLQLLKQIERVQEMLHGKETADVLQLPLFNVDTGHKRARVETSE